MNTHDLVEILQQNPHVHTVTQYHSPKSVTRVTRQGKPHKRNKRNTFIVSIGVPNYLAVKFIKQCVKAGEPFPLKRLQFTHYAIKRKAKKK